MTKLHVALLVAVLVLPAVHAFQTNSPILLHIRDANCPLSLRMSEAGAQKPLSKLVASKAVAYLSAMFVGISAAPQGARAQEVVQDAPSKARLHTASPAEKRTVMLVAGAADESVASGEAVVQRAVAMLAKPTDVQSVLKSIDLTDKKQVAVAASAVSITGLWYIVRSATNKDDNGSSGAPSKASPKAAEKKTESSAEMLLRMKKEEMSKVVLKPGGTGVGMRPSHTGQFDESMSTKGPDVNWKSLDTLMLKRIGSRPPGMETSTIVRQV